MIQGRGPGRPRKDISAVRSSQSYRGSSRGTGRGIIRTARGGQLGTVAPGMVMVQQIKPINPPLAPPPSSPSSASLVPLIKPLVITDRHGHQITSAITGTTGGHITVQKQVHLSLFVFVFEPFFQSDIYLMKYKVMIFMTI